MEESSYSKREYPRNFKVNCFNTIKDFLLISFNNSKQKVVDDFALKHRNLTRSIAAFRLGLKHYQHQLVYSQPFQCKPLHSSLVDDFKDHIASWDVHLDRQHRVDSILVSAFNLMGNTNDLRELLPECIHPTLPLPDSSYPSLSKEKIYKFKETHKETLKLISVQVVIKSIKG